MKWHGWLATALFCATTAFAQPAALDPAAVERLVLLGKVWGFLKYHHPHVTRGRVDWDTALLEVWPAVLAAPDAVAAADLLARWADALPLPDDAPVDDTPPAAATAWITGPDVPGWHLAASLGRVFAHRDTHLPPAGVRVEANGSLAFDEPPHADLAPGDTGRQLLAAYRFWNLAAYWYAYPDLIAPDWDNALRRHVAAVATADTPAAYRQALFRLLGELGDSHTSLWNARADQPPVGRCRLPAALRLVEGRLLVVGADAGAGLRAGDEVIAIDGEVVAGRLAAATPFHPASNAAALARDLARSATRGPCGPAPLVLRRDDGDHRVTAERRPGPAWPHAHDRPGPAFQVLDGDIGYLKVSALTVEAIPAHLDDAAQRAGLVVDLRGYPAEFVVYALAGHLVDRRTPFAQVRLRDPRRPGVLQAGTVRVVPPRLPRHVGPVAVLVDESTQSQAEFTAMALQAGPRTTVFGSRTAGADGDVAFFDLPGELRTSLATIAIAYPDGRPTQRTGIAIDVPVTPTVRGLRAGRDEVLEEAVRHLARR